MRWRAPKGDTSRLDLHTPSPNSPAGFRFRQDDVDRPHPRISLEPATIFNADQSQVHVALCQNAQGRPHLAHQQRDVSQRQTRRPTKHRGNAKPTSKHAYQNLLFLSVRRIRDENRALLSPSKHHLFPHMVTASNSG